MCGIAGAKGVQDGNFVRDMVQALKHRGPDGVGLHSEGDLHIGAQRLSIIDLASGWQPIFNETRAKCIVFNGEIYNYRELQTLLKEKGHVLATQSDTEVILHLYEEYGEQCVDYLRGMFAFAIADGQRLFLARDRLGIKPLYYTLIKDNRLFLFASEIKALLQCKEVPAALDMQTFTDNLMLSHPVGSRTFLEHIKSLPPGSTMFVSNNHQGVIQLNEKQYYRVSLDPDETLNLAEAQKRLTEMLRSTVASHLIADVEIGLTLSGGLDSSLLALMMQEQKADRMQAFTIADYDEHPDLTQAQSLAADINARHHVVNISFENYLSGIPGCVAAEEQPSTLHGLPFYLLCQHAGRHVKVCLNGEGADELFGGYPEYIDRSHRISALNRRLDLVRETGFRPSAEALQTAEEMLSYDVRDSSLKGLFELNLKDQLVRHHLEIVDKYSMSAGMECRVPYVDHELVDFVNTLPLRFKVDARRGIQKYLLKRLSLENYGSLLFDVVLRQKIGFPAAGMRSLHRLKRLCDEMLPATYLKRHELGFCFADKLELLLFELFCEIFIKHRGLLPVEFDLMEFIKSRS